jgi:hypothetical protein
MCQTKLKNSNENVSITIFIGKQTSKNQNICQVDNNNETLQQRRTQVMTIWVTLKF